MNRSEYLSFEAISIALRSVVREVSLGEQETRELLDTRIESAMKELPPGASCDERAIIFAADGVRSASVRVNTPGMASPVVLNESFAGIPQARIDEVEMRATEILATATCFDEATIGIEEFLVEIRKDPRISPKSKGFTVGFQPGGYRRLEFVLFLNDESSGGSVRYSFVILTPPKGTGIAPRQVRCFFSSPGPS